MKSRSVCLAIVSLCAVGTAHAEPPAAVEYGFEDELVPGDLMRPHGEVVQVRQRNMRTSLIEIRASYLPELLKSVEDL